MPLFDTQCSGCGNVIESIIPKCPDDFTIVQLCSFCQSNMQFDILPPMVSMQPDNMWFHGNTQLGHFNSKKEYKQYIKNNNLELATRHNYESAQKNQSNRFETVAKKNKEKLNKFIEKEVANTIDLPVD